MHKLSKRHNLLSCRAGIETPSQGGNIGVSTSARIAWRKHFQGVPGMLGSNDQVNYLIAVDYAGSVPVHRFLLKTNEPCEIRKSSSFYYLAVIRRNKKHDVIIIQPAYKESPATSSKPRMTDEWLDKVFRGDIKKK